MTHMEDLARQLGGGWWLNHPKPWKAEPMDPARPDGPWKVTCPSKSGKGMDEVATYLSEKNAKEIAGWRDDE